MAEITTTEKEFIKILADIIQHELELSAGQVFIYNQDFKIPNTNGLFIVLSYASSPRVMANDNSITEDDDGDLVEEQCANMQEEIAIDIMSRDNTARVRKEEVILALNSVYAQSQQEAYQFRVFTQPAAFTDVSEAEGAARINRYQCIVTLFTSYRKSKKIEYYDRFRYNLETNK